MINTADAQVLGATAQNFNFNVNFYIGFVHTFKRLAIYNHNQSVKLTTLQGMEFLLKTQLFWVIMLCKW